MIEHHENDSISADYMSLGNGLLKSWSGNNCGAVVEQICLIFAFSTAIRNPRSISLSRASIGFSVKELVRDQTIAQAS